MRTRNTLMLIALTAVALVALAAGSASARRFKLNNQRFLAIWSVLRFETEGFETVECPVTLEGSFHSATLSKVCGQLIGYVSRAIVRGGLGECFNTGRATILSTTLPWHIRYESFSGALPGITGIKIQLIGASFRVKPVNQLLECLARTEAAHPARGIVNITGAAEEAIRKANTLTADSNSTIPIGGSAACDFAAAESRFSGTAEVFLLGATTTRILVELVQ